jgi:hypothetical protein
LSCFCVNAICASQNGESPEQANISTPGGGFSPYENLFAYVGDKLTPMVVDFVLENDSLFRHAYLTIYGDELFAIYI